MNNEEIIKKAVEESKAFPNPTIEYNFDDEVDIKLFEGVKAVKNPMAGKNIAKVIYKMG